MMTKSRSFKIVAFAAVFVLWMLTLLISYFVGAVRGSGVAYYNRYLNDREIVLPIIEKLGASNCANVIMSSTGEVMIDCHCDKELADRLRAEIAREFRALQADFVFMNAGGDSE